MNAKKVIMKCFLLLLGTFVLISCSETEVVDDASFAEKTEQSDGENVNFLVFKTREQLAETIKRMKEKEDFAVTRGGVVSADICEELSETGAETKDFVSLVESKKNEYMSNLSAKQLDSIYNDEDELEFCLSDSIIADYEFAQLLNAAREIQVNDTVYKFFGNGVAFTKASNVKNLRLVDSEVESIAISEDNVGVPLVLGKDVKFIPNAYAESECSEKDTRLPYPNKPALTLKNGVVLSPYDIRDVNYDDDGDGGWIHRLWGGIWGKNVLAIKKFNSRKRLRFGMYDQNYYIYANIGITMKMQKKVCGIWWNCKADEIRMGWSAVELKYTFPSPVIDLFYPNASKEKDVSVAYPQWLKHNFPFKNENSVLFYLPFSTYSVKVKDINSLVKSGVSAAANLGTKALVKVINETPESQRGVYSVDNSILYIAGPADEYEKKKVKTFDKKFYSKWFPGTYEVSFSYNGKLNVEDVSINKDADITLSSCVAYGAVKYNGKWLAARITKNR